MPFIIQLLVLTLVLIPLFVISQLLLPEEEKNHNDNGSKKNDGENKKDRQE